MKLTTIALLGLMTMATLALAEPASAQSLRGKTSPRIEAAIRDVINAQRDAWNRGDIAGYMDGYARSADTVFISGDNITYGWETVLQRYKKGYDTREKMGVLTFSELAFNQLSTDAVAVTGRWHLQRASDEPHGRFTLIFRHSKAGWRIVHDHTSSA
jgi:ketosteroid isomerase-like protein